MVFPHIFHPRPVTYSSWQGTNSVQGRCKDQSIAKFVQHWSWSLVWTECWHHGDFALWATGSPSHGAGNHQHSGHTWWNLCWEHCSIMTRTAKHQMVILWALDFPIPGFSWAPGWPWVSSHGVPRHLGARACAIKLPSKRSGRSCQNQCWWCQQVGRGSDDSWGWGLTYPILFISLVVNSGELNPIHFITGIHIK